MSHPAQARAHEDHIDMQDMAREILATNRILSRIERETTPLVIVARVLRGLNLTTSPRLVLGHIMNRNGARLEAFAVEWFVTQVPNAANEVDEHPVLAAQVASSFLPDEPVDVRPSVCPFCRQPVSETQDVGQFSGTNGHFTCTTRLTIRELTARVESLSGRVPV